MADAFQDDTATWVDPAGRRLSERIWGNRARLRDTIDRELRAGMLAGESIDQVSERLLPYVRPSYARYGSGKARHAASRLATHETRRGHAIATQQVAVTNPTGGYLRYTTSAGHVGQDACTGYASHTEGYGRGVYPARDCPLPPIHIGCTCSVAEVGVDARGMVAFVDQLRVAYELDDPPDLSPDELLVFRRETQGIRDAVQLMFRAWFEQTGLVSREQLMDVSPTVADWVTRVRDEKQRRRG